MSKSDEFTRTEAAAEFIRSRITVAPKVALVLGSGLGAFADEIAEPVRIHYSEISGFPRSSAEGHAGQLVIGKIGGLAIAAMQGRVHLYEGHSIQDVAFPIRVLGRLGIRAAVLTNAAGGIGAQFKQGGLVVVKDHINLQGLNPLTGPNDPRFGVRFIDMTEAYARDYRQIAMEEGRQLGSHMLEGVYAALGGPSYETPAEIRYLRVIGADLVGMSTVPEVIIARHMGIKVLAISCVTNMAAGILDQPINHAEVLETGERVRAEFSALLRAVLPRIGADVASSGRDRQH